MSSSALPFYIEETLGANRWKSGLTSGRPIQLPYQSFIRPTRSPPPSQPSQRPFNAHTDIFAIRDDTVGKGKAPSTAARPQWPPSFLDPSSPDPTKIYVRPLPQIRPCSTCITLRKTPRRTPCDHSIALRLTTAPTVPQPLRMATDLSQCHRDPTLAWPTEGRDIELLPVAWAWMVQEARPTPKVPSRPPHTLEVSSADPRVLRYLARAVQVLQIRPMSSRPSLPILTLHRHLNR